MAKPNWKDKTIWTADNLVVMRGMNSESIDLIYLDPPFNSKRNYAAPTGSKAAGAEFKDTWTLSDVDVEWINLIGQKHPKLERVILAAMTNSDKSYLAYMAVRILEMQRILKPTGSIYLHCDPTMSHYLKLVMDAVFGKAAFRNEIVWRKYAGRKNNAKTKFSTQHDSIFFYAKSAMAKFNGVMLPHTEKEIAAKYKHIDKEGRRYRLAWGRQYQMTGKNRKIYLDESPGRAVGNLWVEEGLQLNTSSSERTSYPTQKPLALLERIIKASSDPSGKGGGGQLYSTPSAGARRRWWRQTVCNGNGLAWMYRRKRPSWWSGASKRNRGYSSLSFIARTYRRGRTWDACPGTIAPQTKRSCTANRADIAPVAASTSQNRDWKSTISPRRAGGEQTTSAIYNCYVPFATKSKATVVWGT